MTPSGPAWVAKFPPSRSTNDLVEPFRTRVENFLDALKDAGAEVSIADTYRPPERAHLMHHAFLVGKQQFNPTLVPAMPGVDIDWAHLDAQGHPNLPAAITAAAQMVSGYQIVFAPALTTRHTQGLAVDMNISWPGILTLTDGNGLRTTVSTLPRSGLNPDLHAVGETFGVIKLVKDAPHWSSDGH